MRLAGPLRARTRVSWLASPPTGKQVKVSAMSITRFEGGKIAEEWELADQMGLMQQLGVVPTRE